MGLGTGFLFTPSTAIIGIHFKRRRSLAYGIALTGISIGALVFPIRKSSKWYELFQIEANSTSSVEVNTHPLTL